MKVLGIVAEYNPFHNGHMYHIEESKKLTGCDAVVCVMSGNFIQRGEPAIINKFARTEIALGNGVDLIIELPVPFAVSSAEFFAYGAVSILNSIGIVDCISFGSESGDIRSLQKLAEILVSEPESYRDELKKQLSSGLSFPVCRQKALEKYFKIQNDFIEDLSYLLETSNNILALEYLKALIKLNSPIQPFTVKRISNSYNTPELTGNISSATAIRNSIYESEIVASRQALPTLAQQILEREISMGRGPNSLYSFENIILAFLRHATPQELENIQDVSEGLEYRIKNAAENSGSFDDLLANICTKRYPKTRIQRILMSLLAGMKRIDIEKFMETGGPQYARILGFNGIGRELLSLMKKKSAIPVVTKTSDYKSSNDSLISRMLEIESKATDTYVLAYKNPAFRKAGQEFTQNIVICR